MATPNTSYSPPQTLVYQEFNQVASAITVNLQALIAGPQAYLCRHGVAAEKSLGLLGDYNPAITSPYSWPGRPAGAVVDAGYTKLFADNAKLEYISFFADGDASIAPIAGARNQLTCSNTAGGFAADGTSNPRYAALHDRDVQVGDLVTVRGVGSDSVVYTVPTYVAGVTSTGSQRAASTIQSAPTAASSNGATQTAAAVVTLVSGTSPNLTLTAGVGAYSALADGVLVETYTITVVNGSIGGDLTTATFRVTSASGLDDVISAAPGASTVAVAIGHRGLTLTFTQTTGTPDLIAGQAWQAVVHSAYVAPVAAAAGTYIGTSNTTYVVTCTRGGLFASGAAPQVSITSTTGIDSSGPVSITATGSAVSAGTLGVTFRLASTGTPIGIRKGDSWTIAVTAAADGAYRTLVLGRNLPAALANATALDLHLAIGRNVQISAAGAAPSVPNWVQADETITVSSGLVAYDSTWTSNGVPLPLPVVAGTLYVEYRAFLIDYVGDIGSISDPGTLDSLIAGPLTPDNPLKFGVYKALAEANGATVNFTGILDPTSLTEWAALLGTLIGVGGIYNIVPLTADRAVHDLVAAHVADQSSPSAGRWRGMFVPLTAHDAIAVVNASTSTDHATVVGSFSLDPNAATTAYTIVEVPAANADFITNGVKAGDTLRSFYGTDNAGAPIYREFVVDAVLTEDSVRLVSGPTSAINVPQLIEIWHPYTKNELAASIGQQSGSFGTSRVCAVWPDTIMSAGTALPGYFLCCSLAGQVSGVAPQRPLTNLALNGYDSVPRSNKLFNADQLNIMAGYGTWVVTQDNNGAVKTRQGITTNPTDINSSEEMVRRNVDSISLLFLARYAPFIGQMNVTPSAIAQLHIETVSIIEYLKQASFTTALGPQLIDATIVELRQSPIAKDQVIVVLDLTVPYALNTIKLYLVI